MKMNAFEKFAMNSPIRTAFQKWYEAPLLERLGGKTEGMTVLEIGCGKGVGTQLILERFKARRVHSIDIDPDMVARARRRLAAIPLERCQIDVGDVTQLPFGDGSFDACINFAALHHVPDWQRAVREIHRALRSGGNFYFQEVTSHALDKWFYRTFMEHPTENRFSAQQFVDELTALGFEMTGGPVEKYGGDFVYGVAAKSP